MEKLCSLYNNLIKLEKRIESSLIDDEPIIKFIYEYCKILTDENGIRVLINSYSKNNIPIPISNPILFNVAFQLGILSGILDVTDDISFICTDFTDEYTLEDIRELKSNLEEVSKYLNAFITKIRPSNSKYNAVSSLLNSANVLISHDNFLIYNNQTLDYSKISGCISLVTISIKRFVKYYLELDFAETNSVNITNIFYFFGVIAGIMNSKDIDNSLIVEYIEFISKIFKAL